MSANETAMSSIMGTTGCTAAQAEAALAELVELGWMSPPELPKAIPALPGVAVPSAGGVLTAHTDGACSGNPGPGGWAVLFSQGGVVLSEHSGGVDNATNNRTELTAIREAMSRAPSDVELEIVTDSANAIGWLSRGWKRNEPAIAALCRDIETLAAKRSGKITYRHVRGHRGDPLNERTDKLATGVISGRAQRW